VADYYTQVSMEVEDLTHKERDWFARRLDWKQITDAEFLEYAAEYTDDIDEKEFWPPFNAKLQEDKTVWFSDDAGSIDIGALCCLLCDFLRDCRPNQCVCLEWANTASRPLLDSFSGGSAFITHDNVVLHSTYDWLSKQEEEFNAKIKEVESNG
jgi:hypothetical protein